MHPLYYTTGFAERYAAERDLPLVKVQHHHAHVASVMAENDIKGKVIGVSFDGTGYGTDGSIWGGEFFICEGGDCQRIAHLKYVNMIGGESSVKDAAALLSAISMPSTTDIFPYGLTMTTDFSGHDLPRRIAVDISDIIDYGRERLLAADDHRIVMSALSAGINTVHSSSMGRLFDGVAALLGIKDYNDYEGQCAIMLEDAAAFARKHPGKISPLIWLCRFMRGYPT